MSAVAPKHRHCNMLSVFALQKFLVKYGYLESNKNYYPERELTRATKNFQKINNLNPSGLFDRETLDLMTAPRCGMSDWRMRVESVISQKGNLLFCKSIIGQTYSTGTCISIKCQVGKLLLFSADAQV